MLVDSHCHLDFPQFEGDIAGVLARARNAGVGRMVTICTRLRESPRVQAIAEAHAPIYFAAGNHPLNVGEEPEASVADLVALAAHPKMVGIGESGLDYYYDRAPRDVQERAFRTHIQAARATGLPLIVHARDADDDIERILRDEYAAGAYPCVMHCFSSGWKLGQAALEMGFYLSMSGVATFRNAQSVRDMFAQTPLDRILVETDAPYLAPMPHRGKRNEPAYVALTAAVGAEVKGLAVEDFARATTDNFHRLFSKVPRAEGAST